MPGTAFSTSNWDGYDEHATSLAPSAALTDFTVLIDISNLSATWKGNVQSDGADIRLTKDDDTEIPFDLIDWAYNAGAPTGLIRAKWSGTLATSGTQKLRVWAGYNAGGSAVAYDADETYGSDNAFHVDVEAYWPLSGDFDDRTVNANHLTSHGGITAGGAAGKDGRSATEFDGSGDYLRNATFASPTDQYTIMLWAYADTRPTWATLAKNWGHSVGGFAHYGLSSTTGELSNFIRESNNDQVGPIESPSAFPTEEWTHVAAVADGSDMRIYLDGAEVGTPISYDGTLRTTFGALGVGVKFENDESTPASINPGYWDGRMETIWFDQRGLSAAWIALEYALTNDNAATLGAFSWTASGGGGASLTKELSESIALGDNDATEAGFVRDYDDPVALAEALANAVGFVREYGEAVALGEDLATAAGVVRALADALVLGEAVAPAAGFVRDYDDALSVGEAVEVSLVIVEALADGMTLGEAVALAAGYGLSVQDAVALGEALATAAGKVRAFADAVALGEELSTQGAFVRSFSSGVSLSESFSTAAGFSESRADPVAVGEVVAAEIVVPSGVAGLDVDGPLYAKSAASASGLAAGGPSAGGKGSGSVSMEGEAS